MLWGPQAVLMEMQCPAQVRQSSLLGWIVNNSSKYIKTTEVI